jgi:ABC-type amino acid transport substrate-binding protein
MIRSLLWLALLMLICNQVQAQPQLRWCLGNFPGFYGFNAKTKQPEGLSVNYLQEIARRAGFTLLPSAETPSSRCFAQMKTGETDLMINILKQQNEEIHYLQFGARWPDRVYSERSKNLRLDTPGQLAALTLATIRTYHTAPEIQLVLDSMSQRQLVKVDSVLTALQMVARQRIDAAVLPPTQVATVLAQHPELVAALKETAFSSELVKPQPIYMGLSSHCNCPQLEQAIQQSILSMKADGSSQRIFGDKIIADF